MLRSVLAALPEDESGHKHQVGEAQRTEESKRFPRWISVKNSAGRIERRFIRSRPSRQYQNKSEPASSVPTLASKAAKTRKVPAVLTHRHILKSVSQCTRQGGRGWILWLWAQACPDLKICCPYYCGSHRCVHPDGSPTECARHNAAVMFARIKEALDPYTAAACVTCVLTLDRNGFYGGRKWLDVNEAYRGLLKLFDDFMHRIRRWLKRMGFAPLRNEWVSVTESHASGWPHVNVLIVHPELARYVEDSRLERIAQGKSVNAARLFDGELLDIIVNSGWGRQSSIEPVKSKDCMAAYIAKVTQHYDAMLGEIAKLTQTPLNAPAHFRRLRSGKGFLPPRRFNPLWTGAFVRMYYDPQWGYVAEAMRSKTKPTEPARNEQLQQVERLTEDLYHRDLEALARGQPPPPRIQRIYRRGKEVEKQADSVVGVPASSEPHELASFAVRWRGA